MSVQSTFSRYIAFSLLLCSSDVGAQETTQPLVPPLPTNEEELCASEEEASKKFFADSIVNAPTSRAEAIKQTQRLFNTIACETRMSQDLVYRFSRSIRKNIYEQGLSEEDHLDRIDQLTLELLTDSFSDNLFRNRNLVRQLTTRLPGLLTDSISLKSDTERKHFAQELEVVHGRLERTRKFRLGIGASFTYLPGIEFEQQQSVDLSVFQGSTLAMDPVVLDFNSVVDFSNRSVPGLLLSAKVPYVQFDAILPFFTKSEVTLFPVESLNLNGNGVNTLNRVNISSELDVEYDVSFRAQLLEIYEDAFGRPKRKSKSTKTKFSEQAVNEYVQEARWYQNFELGVGFGLLGTRFRNVAEVDTRFPTAEGQLFELLPQNNLAPLRDLSLIHI